MGNLRTILQANHVAMLTSGHHHCRPGWIQLHCPHCSGGRSGWHLGFNPATGAWSCWRCGALKFWDIVPDVLRMDTKAVKQLLAKENPATRTIRPPRIPTVRKPTLKPPDNAGPLAAVHKQYLEKRGFNPDQLEKDYNLLGTRHLGGEWAWRIIIPVCNLDKRLVAYQGRTIGNAQPRYKMTADKDCLDDPDTMIYGIDKVPGDTVIVVEGCPGVWCVGRGTVGTFGIDWKLPQVNRLRRFKKRFVLFDPEPKAQDRARELAQALSMFPGTTEILSGFDTDPGEFPPDVVREVRQATGLA